MQAMVLERLGEPLRLVERPDPEPGDGEVRVRVAACGVCRTDLHVVDGELPNPKLPIVPGHEIVGRVDAVGAGVDALAVGMRVGIPWLGKTCGHCPYCRERPGKSLRSSAVHRLYARRRLCHPCRCRCALRVPAAARAATMWRRAVAVRRPDRLALAADGRRRQEDRLLRLRRRRPHHRPGGALAGPRCVCLHAAGRQRRAGVRPEARRASGPAAPTRRRPKRSMRHHLCAGRRARARGAARGAQGRPRGLRRHPHERYSELSLQYAVGGTGA